MKKAILFLCLASAIVSCKKDKPENQTITINPMKEIAAMNPNTTSDGSSGKYQVGVRFLTRKEGTISKLGLRSPSAGTYRLQLYTFVATDSTFLNYPLVSAAQRLAYADVTIDAAAAANGTVVWTNIATTKVMTWDSDGAGKVRMYGVCYNDQDLKQYQVTLPTGVTMPMQFGGNLSLLRYTYRQTNDQDQSPWDASTGGYENIVYGGEQFEFVCNK